MLYSQIYYNFVKGEKQLRKSKKYVMRKTALTI